MRDVLVVLPTYNEAASIEEVLRRARASVPDAGVLVVDDGSPDGTADIADRVSAELGAIHVMRRKERSGLGAAYLEGFTWGMERGAKVLVEMDSDLSHDPGALPELLAALGDADLVIGSRYVPGGSIPDWSLHRRLLSKWGNLYSSFMLGVPVRDMTSGYRAYRRSLLESIHLDQVQADGYGFQIEMAYRSYQEGGRLAEVPIRFLDRQLGESKMHSMIIVEALALVTKWGVVRRARRSEERRSPAPHASAVRS